MDRTAKRTTGVIPSVFNQSAHPTLADYVRQMRHERNLSLAEVSARSGGQIGPTHVNRIENKNVRNVTLPKLRALAKGLGVPEDELLAIARGRFPHSKKDALQKELLNYFNELPEEAQRYALYMVRGLAVGVEHGVRRKGQPKTDRT